MSVSTDLKRFASPQYLPWTTYVASRKKLERCTIDLAQGVLIMTQ